ncbi:MAG TPA: trypsin-like peptidase domain-containing protein [Anaerolineales bacterium]|nr:trypsin-like peptidase domain-containing protein [Anaerolineales bacterium]
MKPKHKIFLPIAALILTALACQTFGGTPAADTLIPTPVVQVEQPAIENTSANEPIFLPPDSLTALYEQVSPGVVAIRVLTEAGGGQGSGFVIDADGHIVTNYHVVEGATDIEVDFTSGFKTRGTVVGIDLDSDLAVLKVDAPAEEIHPLPMGDSEQVKVGQLVVAIGNPFGLSSTMTVGIVSAKGRTLSSLNTTSTGNTYSAGDILQTDAAINPGNSGGPLLNLNGEVIGVNRAIQTEAFSTEGEPVNSGIGFAISINIVKRVVPFLIEQGYYEYPLLGVSSPEEISLFDQEELGLTQSTGALVTMVVEGGPAEAGGVRVGDLITHVDGREIRVFGDMISYLMTSKGPGDQVTITVIRNGETLDLTVTLGSRGVNQP